MSEKRINIAIDGPSGVGKSSVAKLLAKQLGYFFISSGSLYRLCALLAIENNIKLSDGQKVANFWEFEEVKVDNQERWFYRNRDVTNDLRKDEISSAASDVAIHPAVRQKIVDFLQWYSESYRGVIIDGRDATYRILPNAELKIFLWADAEVRAQRRVLQNYELGLKTNYDDVLNDIKQRDYQDTHRAKDPLICSEGSIRIDSTNKDLLEVYGEIYNLAIAKIKEVY